MCTYKSVFNSGLTGVPRSVRIGLMGVFNVTRVTSEAVFFTAAYGTQQFSLLQEYVNLYVGADSCWNCFVFVCFLRYKTLEFCIVYCFTNPQPNWLQDYRTVLGR